MNLRLIGPNDEYHFEWTFDNNPPAVMLYNARVWVKGSNSTTDNQMYFEQQGWHLASSTEMILVK